MKYLTLDLIHELRTVLTEVSKTGNTKNPRCDFALSKLPTVNVADERNGSTNSPSVSISPSEELDLIHIARKVLVDVGQTSSMYAYAKFLVGKLPVTHIQHEDGATDEDPAVELKSIIDEYRKYYAVDYPFYYRYY